MNDLNSFFCVCRLTRDPELRYTPNQKATAKFGIAINRSYRNTAGEEIKAPLFINVVTWGKVAESCANYIHKGSKVAISGELKSNTWEDDAGNKRVNFEINAQIVQFLDSRPQGQQVQQDIPGEQSHARPARGNQAEREEYNSEQPPF